MNDDEMFSIMNLLDPVLRNVNSGTYVRAFSEAFLLHAYYYLSKFFDWLILVSFILLFNRFPYYFNQH